VYCALKEQCQQAMQQQAIINKLRPLSTVPLVAASLSVTKESVAA